MTEVTEVYADAMRRIYYYSLHFTSPTSLLSLPTESFPPHGFLPHLPSFPPYFLSSFLPFNLIICLPFVSPTVPSSPPCASLIPLSRPSPFYHPPFLPSVPSSFPFSLRAPKEGRGWRIGDINNLIEREPIKTSRILRKIVLPLSQRCVFLLCIRH